MKSIRYDIVIIEREKFDKYYDGENSNWDKIIKCDKVATIEIKHILKYSDKKKEGFEKDLKNLKSANSKYKYFISLNCENQFEKEYKEKFEDYGIKTSFKDTGFFKNKKDITIKRD